MDANQLVIALNNILDLADTLDSSGIGISAMTNGSHTTREICKTELGQFLLYVGDGAPSFTDGQAALINIVLGDVYGQSPAWRLKLAASQLDAPKAGDNLTYLAFQTADAAIAQRNGVPSTQTRDLLISLYESFGTLLVMLNQNAVSQARYTEYVSALKNRMNDSDSSRSAAPEPPTKPVSKPAPKEKPSLTTDVSELIPAGVSLTDSQKEYLAGVAETMREKGQGSVRQADVAAYMGRTSSAVSSAVRTLIKKGVLESNESGEIMLAAKKAKSVSPGSPASKGSAKAQKTADPKKTDPKKPSGIAAQYNDLVSFVLPAGYELIREPGDGAEEKVEIRFGPYTDDNGQEKYEFNASLSEIEVIDSEDDKIPAGESPYQTVIRRNAQSKNTILSEKLKTALIIREAPLNILGRVLKLYALMLIVETDDHHVLSITDITQWDEENSETNLTHYRHMMDVIEAMRVRGEKLPGLKLDAEELMEQMSPDFEGKESIKGSIGLQIKNGDEVVSESKLVGDDDGTIHTVHIKENKQVADGKYGEIEVKNGWVAKCMKKAVKISVPEGVTGIDDNAFEKCTKLEEVILPDGIEFIGSNAFSGCVKLKKIVLPDSIKNIGMFAFSECKSLTEVKLPASLTYISLYLFQDCEKLTSVTVPASVTQIFTSAFQNCRSLTNITLPDHLEEISSDVFWGCEKLTAIKLPKGIKEIASNLFNECKSLKEIIIPDGMTEIGRFAFSECEKLEKIQIPDTVDEIAMFAFQGCKKLKKIRLPSQLTVIDENLFEDCESLTEVEMPADLDMIKEYAFRGCKSLKKVNLPAHISGMEEGVFEGCESLETAAVPEAITEIPDFLFQNCVSLRKITILGEVDSIGHYAFSGCEKLTEIDLPDSLTKIEDGAFAGCESLRQIVIPDSVQSIGDFAFTRCVNLKQISMPGTAVVTSDYAFPSETQITYRMSGGRKTTRKPSASKSAEPAAKISEPKTAGRFGLATPDDEIYTHYGKLKREHDKFTGMGIQHVSNNGKEHEAIPLLQLMERQSKTNTAVYRKLKEIESRDRYPLKDTALQIAQVFRVAQAQFNARHDDEGDIGVTMLEHKWQFSALRSFAWTLADLADREGKSIDDYEADDLTEICEFIEERQWLNYEAGSWFDGLCGHPDLHVYYMPQKMIDDGSAAEICNVFNDNPIVSLDAFRNDLSLLKNAMIRIHNQLLKTRDRTVKLDSPEAAVLKTWCALVMSAETAFFSEDGPMLFFHSYPDTPLNTKPLAIGAKATALKKPAPAKKKEEPSSAMAHAASYEIVKGPDGKDRIKLGEYPVGQPIVWLILENNPSDLLLISEYGLDAKSFSDMTYNYQKTGQFGSSTSVWSESTIRQWLNEEFSDEAFTQDEKDMILEDRHDTYQMTNKAEVVETGSVTDRVFLLSAREAHKFFPTQKDLICKATAFAKEQGAAIENGPMQTHWWCRCPEVELMRGLHGWVGCVMADGNIKGWGNTADGVCVRPVIRIKKDGITTGSIPAKPETSASAPKPAKAEKKTTKKAASSTSTAAKASTSTKQKPPAKKASASKAVSAAPAKTPTTDNTKDKVRKLDLGGATSIKDYQFANDRDTRPLEIPDGITDIAMGGFNGAYMESVKLPKSLKRIGKYAFNGCENLMFVEMQEGVEEIGFAAFSKCPKLNVIILPSTIRTIDINAFTDDLVTDETHMLLNLSGETARRLVKNKLYSALPAVRATGFMIDDHFYLTLEEYVEQFEAEERARIERERQERIRREEEQRKERRRAELNEQIRQLEAERDALKGILAVFKRNKIQREIESLRESLRNI